MLNYPVSGFVHPFCTTPIYSAIIKLGRGDDPIRNQFSVMSLFANNEVGAWYDPSDFLPNWRRNLLTYTEQFDNAYWAKNSITATSDVAVSPTGVLTADKIAETTTTAIHFIASPAVSLASATNVTASVYVKAAERTWCIVRFGYQNYGRYVNLATGAVGAIYAAAPDTFTVQDAGNGWYRVTLSKSLSSGNIGLSVDIATSDGVNSYTGDGTSGIYIWGAQLELGNTASAYQKITDGVSDYMTYQPLPILYQDAAGTTPVTAVEQPVGLMLDKSKGLVLGPELVTNGTFDTSSLTGWANYGTGSIAYDSAGLRGIITATGPAGGAYLTLNCVVGKTYKVVFELTAGTKSAVRSLIGANGAVGNVGDTNQILSGVPTQRTIVFTAGATTPQLIILDWASTTGNWFVDNISVRELPGNHAYQATSANRPVLSARVNLLTKTEDFSDAAWSKNGVTVSGQTIREISTTGGHSLVVASSQAPINSVNTITLEAKAAKRSRIVIQHGAFTVGYDLSNGTAADFNGSGATFSITSVGNGWYRCVFTKAITTNNSVIFAIASDANYTTAYAGDDTQDSILLRYPDLRVTNTGVNLPAYQRVNTSTDYDTTGFPLYLKCNGTNTAMQTNSIDFTGTDKMTVLAGVRKLSNAAGIITELSTNFGLNLGSFYAVAGYDIGFHWSFLARGNASADVTQASGVTTPIAPATAVISATSNIAESLNTYRLNASAGSNSTGALGTGNFGNYPLYLFARSGSQYFFNGNLYGLIIRGAQSSDVQISSAEQYMNRKTLAYTQ